MGDGMVYIPGSDSVHLSRNFTLAEFVRTIHGPPEDNYPTSDEQISNLTWLCKSLLQPIRDKFGPLAILSGYRSLAVNRAAGGAPNSQHMTGAAADFRPTLARVGVREIFLWTAAQPLAWGQFIWEHPAGKIEWIHISLPTVGLYRQVLEYDGEGYHNWTTG